jgi:hypothetical protein
MFKFSVECCCPKKHQKPGRPTYWTVSPVETGLISDYDVTSQPTEAGTAAVGSSSIEVTIACFVCKRTALDTAKCTALEIANSYSKCLVASWQLWEFWSRFLVGKLPSAFRA